MICLLIQIPWETLFEPLTNSGKGGILDITIPYFLIKSDGGIGPMKSGNLPARQGAKSGGNER